MNDDDWEYAGSASNNISQTSAIPSDMNNEDWEYSSSDPISQQKVPNESLGMALAKAPGRIGEDITKAGMQFVKNIPNYFDASKIEIPGLLHSKNTLERAKQLMAGDIELGNRLVQLPKNLADYGANRLNILPQSVPNFMNKITPEDATQSINQAFGQPKYPGDALARGIIRNAPEIIGAQKVLSALNPMNYSAKNIAKDVLNEEQNQIKKHTIMYNGLWQDAQNQGINPIVQVNHNLIDKNLNFIKQYKSPRDYMTLQDFKSNPSLPNAQSAVSDLKNMERILDNKSSSSSLTGEERKLLGTVTQTKKHIEDNMFLDSSGNVNQGLLNRYKDINKSYYENVVPYKYNSDIQKYKNKKLLASELKQSLSKGEFAAKKGSEHPELFLGNKIRNALIASGIGSALYGGNKVVDYLYK